MDRSEILTRVFAHYGGAAALAKLLGVTRQAVHAWREVPLRHLKRIAAETNIPREELRPDLYA